MKNLTVDRTLLKTFFFRLELVRVAIAAAIHKLQTVAVFLVVVPSRDEIPTLPGVRPLTAYTCPTWRFGDVNNGRASNSRSRGRGFEATIRWLLLGWVTVCGQVNHLGK